MIATKKKEALPNIFTIVDVETTGMRAQSSRVIDIGIIRMEYGKIVKTYSSYINPGVSISSTITEINGITDDDVRDAPVFEDIALEIEELFKDSVFVAHNASFDYSFLKHEFQRVGIDFEMPSLCSVKLSRMLYPRERGHNLDALIERFDFTCDIRHRAMPDAEVVAQFLTHIKEEFSSQIIDKVFWHLLYGQHAPRLIDQKVIAALPDGAGVYFFYGKDRELLYIGKSKHIRTRVRSHFSDTLSRKESRLCQETVTIEAEETPGELSALLLEASMVKTHMPAYNRVLRKIKQLVIAKPYITEEGFQSLVLEYAEHIDDGQRVLGMFRTLSQAKQKVRALAREHALCEKLLGLEHGSGACFAHQLRQCKGACLNKEDAETYNKRFDEAFKKRKIKTWPFAGPIMIDERGGKEGTGVVFVVDDWRLTSSYLYDNGENREFIAGMNSFDYDTYKILARYISNPANKRTVKTLSKKEIEKSVRELSLEYETIIA